MSGETEVIYVKIVLIGESGVGKTCIISRFVNDMFDSNSLSTSGASYAAKTLRFEEKKASIAAIVEQLDNLATILDKCANSIDANRQSAIENGGNL